MRLTTLWICCLLCMAGCAGGRIAPTDVAESLLPVSGDTARRALVSVLTTARYEVTPVENGHLLRTGYREEIRGPWNWLLVSRFGTLRSRVEATITEEDESITRVRIEVFCEGKDGWLSSWLPYRPPLQREGLTHLRDLRRLLAIL